ncbi:MAG TPA: cupin domain-containing protein [Candidatus Binatia bacterium]|nr:cupin domain-containing protein [Candidatus Binatia bacterium]
MSVLVTNLLRALPSPPSQELFDRLVETDAFLLERIVSFGHTSEPGQWYDQEREEWVLLLSGRARLRFEQPACVVELVPGDSLRIAAHCRHRVEWTEPGRETVWLALHFGARGA